MMPTLSLFNLSIPSFYLIISLAISVSLIWYSYRMHRLQKNYVLNVSFGYDLALIVMLFGFIGARGFHIFYEEWDHYRIFTKDIFKFWNGGYVYFGGAIAAGVASFIYIRLKKENFLKWADVATPALSLSYALGRIGCFFEGCCFGQHCDLPWAIEGRHPTQIYMVLSEFALFIFLNIFQKKISPKLNGRLFLTWVILHSITRFIIEFYRDDDRGSLIFNSLSLSQALSLVFVVLASIAFNFKNKL